MMMSERKNEEENERKESENETDFNCWTEIEVENGNEIRRKWREERSRTVLSSFHNGNESQ